jgi:hypothetical protein
MLRILPLADELVLPQSRQEIYFFNRIGRFLPLAAPQSPSSNGLIVRLPGPIDSHLSLALA